MKWLKKIGHIPGYLVRHTKIVWYRTRLGHLGRHSYLEKPLYLQGHSSIWIGNDVMIRYKGWLSAVPLTGESKAVLRIEGPNRIAPFCHIFATKEIIIEGGVNIAPRCYISDNLHGYEEITVPIMLQPIKQLLPVRIGAGSWLGENVCVIGASIGKHCVIGANAVVTKNIPDYCVAVGIPAKIIKRYNFESQQWEKTNPDGSFIEK